MFLHKLLKWYFENNIYQLLNVRENITHKLSLLQIILFLFETSHYIYFIFLHPSIYKQIKMLHYSASYIFLFPFSIYIIGIIYLIISPFNL